MHEPTEPDSAETTKAQIALLCFVLIVSAAVWAWGYLHLPIWAAMLLWWWPSLFAGALAGAVVAGCYEVLRRCISALATARGRPPRKAE
jgi:fatty acid desaturase